EVTQAVPWVTYVHAYPHTTVRLCFCKVTAWRGEPRGLEDQQLRWVKPAHADQVGDLLPATLPPLRWLQLPDAYGITSIGGRAGLPAFLERLDLALARGPKPVPLRAPNWPRGPAATPLRDAPRAGATQCPSARARLAIN